MLLALVTLLWIPFLRQHFVALSGRTRDCMIFLAVLPVALRLLLLPTHPIPTPDIYDEFSHLLVADTLLHFRLANPAHPLHQFFETFFVLQQPTYSSIYPPGQGLMLAFGRVLSGQAWTGVVLAVAALCSLSYWMLRAWTSPRWALAGGLLAVAEFGPLNTWMNSYWGGALPAAAGCLVFGALPRLHDTWRRRDAVLLGIGVGVHSMTRPFESALLLLSVALFFVPVLRKRNEVFRLAKCLPYVIIAVAPCLVLILAQNKDVTGKWTTLPEQLSQYQYGVPTTLTIGRPATPHRELTPQQELDYRAQALTHGSSTDTLPRFLQRLEYRIRYYRFFFLPPLYLALVAFFFAAKERRMLWVIITLLVFSLGTNLFPYLLPHYLAAVTCLYILISITGLRKLCEFTFRGAQIGREAATIILFLCAAHFIFWYSLHLFERAGMPTKAMQYETWDAINHAGPQRRLEVAAQLASRPGKQLVFVRYWPQHRFQDEWVWNAADIDGSPIVMARDLGTMENEKLRRYYPSRAVWLLEPDSVPPRLTPYTANASSPTAAPQASAPFTDVK
jgi:hypothetical protein